MIEYKPKCVVRKIVNILMYLFGVQYILQMYAFNI